MCDYTNPNPNPDRYIEMLHVLNPQKYLRFKYWRNRNLNAHGKPDCDRGHQHGYLHGIAGMTCPVL